MRYLILSDIHANIDAFEAVLEHASGEWDRVLVLGDLVGYGAEPNAVVDRVKTLAPDAVIRGNHDKAACGIDDGSQFNHVARAAAMWTGTQLTPENLEYIRALPMGPLQIDDLIEICHGTPFDEDHYVFDGNDAAMALRSASRPLCLFGHTHLPRCSR
jgi:predicted phosphodiesterase